MKWPHKLHKKKKKTLVNVLQWWPHVARSVEDFSSIQAFLLLLLNQAVFLYILKLGLHWTQWATWGCHSLSLVRSMMGYPAVRDGQTVSKTKVKYMQLIWKSGWKKQWCNQSHLRLTQSDIYYSLLKHSGDALICIIVSWSRVKLCLYWQLWQILRTN